MTGVDDTTAQDSEGDFVDIVFDGPPDFEGGRFIEVENRKGESIKFGRWLQRPDGYWVLRVGQPVNRAAPASDTITALIDRIENGATFIRGGGYHGTAELMMEAVAALRANRAATMPSQEQVGNAICGKGCNWPECRCSTRWHVERSAEDVLALMQRSSPENHPPTSQG